MPAHSGVESRGEANGLFANLAKSHVIFFSSEHARRHLHLSPSEALAVIAAGRDAGVDRLVVTHAQFEVVNMSFDEMKNAASMGAKLELCAMGVLMGPEAHLAWMRNWRRVKVEETAAAVKEVGAQNFILATDLGQTGNPSPADGLQLFVSDLMKAGLSKDQITTTRE